MIKKCNSIWYNKGHARQDLIRFIQNCIYGNATALFSANSENNYCKMMHLSGIMKSHVLFAGMQRRISDQTRSGHSGIFKEIFLKDSDSI